MLKIVEVSQVDYDKGLVKVRIPDRDNVETNWLAMESFEYDMPDINDLVRVDLDDDDYTNGICKGRYYNKTEMPQPTGPDIYHKRCKKDLIWVYDRQKKKLDLTVEEEFTAATKDFKINCERYNLEAAEKIQICAGTQIEITAPEIIFNGDVLIRGNLSVTGTILEGDSG